MLIFNTTSAKSIMVSFETYFSFQLSSRFFNANRPSSCGTFAYNPTTFTVHKSCDQGTLVQSGAFLAIH